MSATSDYRIVVFGPSGTGKTVFTCAITYYSLNSEWAVEQQNAELRAQLGRMTRTALPIARSTKEEAVIFLNKRKQERYHFICKEGEFFQPDLLEIGRIRAFAAEYEGFVLALNPLWILEDEVLQEDLIYRLALAFQRKGLLAHQAIQSAANAWFLGYEPIQRLPDGRKALKQFTKAEAASLQWNQAQQKVTMSEPDEAEDEVKSLQQELARLLQAGRREGRIYWALFRQIVDEVRQAGGNCLVVLTRRDLWDLCNEVTEAAKAPREEDLYQTVMQQLGVTRAHVLFERWAQTECSWEEGGLPFLFDGDQFTTRAQNFRDKLLGVAKRPKVDEKTHVPPAPVPPVPVPSQTSKPHRIGGSVFAISTATLVLGSALAIYVGVQSDSGLAAVIVLLCALCVGYLIARRY